MITTIDTPEALRARLAQWAAAGLLSSDQSDRILEWERTRGPVTAPATNAAADSPRRGLLVEGLAYLGGVIILVAVTVVLNGYWHTLPLAGRVALTASGGAGLLLAGSLIPQRLGMFAVRLRAALWLLSTACIWGALIVLTDNENYSSERSMLLVSIGTACYAAVLWLIHRSVLQHLAALAAAEFLAVALIAQATPWSALATGGVLTVVAIFWAALSWGHLLPGTDVRRLLPAGPANSKWTELAAWHRRVGWIAAAVGASVGAIVLGAQPDQPWLGLLPVALVLGVAMLIGDLVILSVGAVATLISLPLIVTQYFDSTLAVAVALLGAGGILVALAVVVAQRRLRHPRVAQAPAADPTPGTGAASEV